MSTVASLAQTGKREKVIKTNKKEKRRERVTTITNNRILRVTQPVGREVGRERVARIN